jgi:hypothetical protein
MAGPGTNRESENDSQQLLSEDAGCLSEVVDGRALGFYSGLQSSEKLPYLAHKKSITGLDLQAIFLGLPGENTSKKTVDRNAASVYCHECPP